MRIKNSIFNFALRIVDSPVHLRNLLRYWVYRRKYNISGQFKFKGFEIFLFGDGRISLGALSYIGTGSTINCVPGQKVTIGKGVKISHNVRIYTSTDVADQDFSGKDIKRIEGSVELGDYSWLGANVYIAPGVRIGEGSVVGANSVVVKNVPSDEIWGGVPAKLIRKKSV